MIFLVIFAIIALGTSLDIKDKCDCAKTERVEND